MPSIGPVTATGGEPGGQVTALITGTPGKNNPVYTDEDDRFQGFGGDDRLNGEDGNELLHGGSGWDMLDGARATTC